MAAYVPVGRVKRTLRASGGDYSSYATWAAAEVRNLARHARLRYKPFDAGLHDFNVGETLAFTGSALVALVVESDTVNHELRVLFTSVPTTYPLVSNKVHGNVSGADGIITEWLYQGEIAELEVYDDWPNGHTVANEDLLSWSTDASETSYVHIHPAQGQGHGGRIDRGYFIISDLVDGEYTMRIPCYCLLEGIRFDLSHTGVTTVGHIRMYSQSFIRNCIFTLRGLYNRAIGAVYGPSPYKYYFQNNLFLAVNPDRTTSSIICFVSLDTPGLFVNNLFCGKGNGIRSGAATDELEVYNNIFQVEGAALDESSGNYSFSGSNNITKGTWLPDCHTDVGDEDITLEFRGAESFLLDQKDWEAVETGIDITDLYDRFDYTDIAGSYRVTDFIDIGPYRYTETRDCRSFRFQLKDSAPLYRSLQLLDTDFWIEFQNAAVAGTPVQSLLIHALWDWTKGRTGCRSRAMAEAYLQKLFWDLRGQTGDLILDEFEDTAITHEDYVFAGLTITNGSRNNVVEMELVFTESVPVTSILKVPGRQLYFLDPVKSDYYFRWQDAVVDSFYRFSKENENSLKPIFRAAPVLVRGTPASVYSLYTVNVTAVLDMAVIYDEWFSYSDDYKRHLYEKINRDLQEHKGKIGTLRLDAVRDISELTVGSWNKGMPAAADEGETNTIENAELMDVTCGDMSGDRFLQIDLQFRFNFTYDASQWS